MTDLLGGEFEVIQSIVIEGDLPATFAELINAVTDQLDSIDAAHGTQTVGIADLQILVE